MTEETDLYKKAEDERLLRRLGGLWKLLFGRTTMFVLLLLIQAMALLGGSYFLGSKVIVINYVIGFLSVLILVYLLNSNSDANFKLMWIILIASVPVFGVTLFIYTRIQPGTASIANRVEQLLNEQRTYLAPDRCTIERELVDARQEYGIFKYIYEDGHYPSYDDACVKYLPSGEEKFKELMDQLRRAEKFIFLEYFIIDRGQMWDAVLDVLKAKAEQGVEVRLMYDGTCTLSLLPRKYPQEMEQLGIQCKVFAPMVPFLSTHQNNRDHRKIAVIDGHVAFTGGVNLADEYINRRLRFGHWKDASIMVEGKAVNSFTLMFLQMWNIDETRREEYHRYIVTETGSPDPGMKQGGLIAPFGDSPLDTEAVGEKVYLDIINRADKYVHIMTPYLILTETMIHSLIFAAQRGIEVKIILPHIPDKKYAYWLARTYYGELIRGGVKIYEYTPGFVHAKVFVSDDIRGVTGTINLDYRSLYLHFECAAYIYNNPVVDDMEKDFQKTLRKCQRITLEECRNYSVPAKIAGRALRIVAPLM